MKKEWMLLCCLVFLGIILLVLNINSETIKQEVSKQEVVAVYISYIELHEYFDGLDQEEIEKQVNGIVTNLSNDGFNWIILHTRSFSDSIYSSEVFPVNYSITRDEKTTLSVDILQLFIEQAHKKDIKVHAWVNPYRIRNNIDIASISYQNPCFKWFGTEHVKILEGKGIFYNPASLEVQDLIVQGIIEIVKKYEIDGIHLDDYFYPTTAEDFDLSFYQQYLDNGGTLELNEYRMEKVNELIKKIYSQIKSINSDVLFGIAPEGNMENNYQYHYADISKWVSEEGYVDYIMPQLYYGFQNQVKPFIETLNTWNDLIKNNSVSLIPAVALYKSGNTDQYAKLGINEWLTYDCIIARQVQIARNMSKYKGFAVYRYDNLYNAANYNMEQEVFNLQQILEK